MKLLIMNSCANRLVSRFTTAPRPLPTTEAYDWQNQGRKTDEQMLQDLRSVLASHGRLSSPILNAAPRLVSSHKLKWRFGRLDRAYELIGYDWKKDLPKAKRKT
jgi:hypothetical protein